MKKRLLYLILFFLLFEICSCRTSNQIIDYNDGSELDNNVNENLSTNIKSEMVQDNIDSESDNPSTKQTTCVESSKTENTVINRVISTQNVPDDVINRNINLGDSIELDFVHMSIDNLTIVDEIYPADTSDGSFLYIEDDIGTKYVVLRGTIKNLGVVNLESTYFNGSLLINDKYEYSLYLNISANPKTTTDFSIAPLEESDYFIYAVVPDDAVDILENGKIRISFNDNFERSSKDKYEYNYELLFVGDDK